VASPQKENGFTPVAHELAKAISQARLGPAERAIWDCIAHYTYGWSRRSAQISRKQFAEWTGYSERQVGRCLQLLGRAKMVWSDKGTRPTTWGVQKDYETWVPMTDLEGHDDGQQPEDGWPTKKDIMMADLDGHDDVHPLSNKQEARGEDECSNEHSPLRADGGNKKPKRKSWLTVFGEAWKRKVGADPNWKRLARELGILKRAYTLEKIERNWREYLYQTPTKYLSPTRFRETFSWWDPVIRQRTRIDKALDEKRKRKEAEASQRTGGMQSMGELLGDVTW
jgi:phage replication O-like protein O